MKAFSEELRLRKVVVLMTLIFRIELSNLRRVVLLVALKIILN